MSEYLEMLVLLQGDDGWISGPGHIADGADMDDEGRVDDVTMAPPEMSSIIRWNRYR